MDNRSAGKGGFTLIEWLVVIAVIAVLMGIMIPVLGKVRKQAKTVSGPIEGRN
jgi:prepilin-type N-terminal cleavage/methylation domain-containing protein